MKRKTLLHYTDAGAIHSILLNKSIWLTDLRFLNDSRELFDGIDTFSNVLGKPRHGLFTNNDYRKESTEFLQKAFSDNISFGISEEPVFVFSLSRINNQLSQWRAYGSYAIEFDERILREEVSNLQECVYVQNKKNEMAKYSVTSALADISQEMGGNEGRTGIKSLDALSKIMERAATFKDEGFSEEQEFRIVERAEEGGDLIKFRHKGNKLIPYLELNISLDCIKAIHVGPMGEQELAYTSMASFVRKIEYDWQIESSNIEYELTVIKSSIPFRGDV